MTSKYPEDTMQQMQMLLLDKNSSASKLMKTLNSRSRFIPEVKILKTCCSIDYFIVTSLASLAIHLQKPGYPTTDKSS